MSFFRMTLSTPATWAPSMHNSQREAVEEQNYSTLEKSLRMLVNSYVQQHTTSPTCKCRRRGGHGTQSKGTSGLKSSSCFHPNMHYEPDVRARTQFTPSHRVAKTSPSCRSDHTMPERCDQLANKDDRGILTRVRFFCCEPVDCVSAPPFGAVAEAAMGSGRRKGCSGSQTCQHIVDSNFVFPEGWVSVPLF